MGVLCVNSTDTLHEAASMLVLYSRAYGIQWFLLTYIHYAYYYEVTQRLSPTPFLEQFQPCDIHVGVLIVTVVYNNQECAILCLVYQISSMKI